MKPLLKRERRENPQKIWVKKKKRDKKTSVFFRGGRKRENQGAAGERKEGMKERD